SFGAMLYEMLTGRRAFGGGSVGEMMSAILKEEPPELAEINSTIPAQLERLVRHCLEKRLEERFQSARDLGFALSALSTPSGSRLETADVLPAAVTESMGAPRMMSRERLAWIIGGILLLALLASLPFALAYFRQAPPPDARVMKL